MSNHQQAETFDSLRPYLFAIAYRMLGSVMDAEDMVQEAFLRWETVDPSAVTEPKSYLATIVTRLCLDQLKSAQHRREQYVGEWLPEPLPTAAISAEMPAVDTLVQLNDSLSVAFLHLLERLTPMERAAFLLRTVFDYPYDEIAAMLETSPANCRQLVSRARQRVVAGRPRFETSAEEQQRILDQFVHACLQGDLDGLLAILADDVVEYSDGGGHVKAALKPIVGAERVAAFLLGIVRQRPPNTELSMTRFNDQPSLLIRVSGQPYAVMLFELGHGRVQRIYNVLNPDKLRGIDSAE